MCNYLCNLVLCLCNNCCGGVFSNCNVPHADGDVHDSYCDDIARILATDIRCDNVSATYPFAMANVSHCCCTFHVDLCLRYVDGESGVVVVGDGVGCYENGG